MDDYPFDREYWLVDVGIPVARLGDRDAILAEVERLAESRGGRPHMRSEPAPGFAGRPGYETFGCSIAFEAGDANAEGFVALVARRLGHLGATASLDPDRVFGPDEEPDAGSGPRF